MLPIELGADQGEVAAPVDARVVAFEGRVDRPDRQPAWMVVELAAGPDGADPPTGKGTIEVTTDLAG